MSENESTPRYTLRTSAALAISVGYDSGHVSLAPCVNGEFAAFIRDEQTDDLYVVTPSGAKIGFFVSTYGVNQVMAIPTRVGNGTQWLNAWLDCLDTNPTTMPRDGMWEVCQSGQQQINGYKRHGELLPFLGTDDRTDSGLPNGFGTVNTIEFYVREPDPEGTKIDSNGNIIRLPQGMTAKGASISAGFPVSDPTISTEVTYQSTAYLLAHIKFIDPQQALDMIHESYPGVLIDPANLAAWISDSSAIKAMFPKLNSITVKPQPYVDDTVENSGGADTDNGESTLII